MPLSEFVGEGKLSGFEVGDEERDKALNGLIIVTFGRLEVVGEPCGCRASRYCKKSMKTRVNTQLQHRKQLTKYIRDA